MEISSATTSEIFTETSSEFRGFLQEFHWRMFSKNSSIEFFRNFAKNSLKIPMVIFSWFLLTISWKILSGIPAENSTRIFIEIASVDLPEISPRSCWDNLWKNASALPQKILKKKFCRFLQQILGLKNPKQFVEEYLKELLKTFLEESHEIFEWVFLRIAWKNPWIYGVIPEGTSREIPQTISERVPGKISEFLKENLTIIS